MQVTRYIERYGFRRWYERQLIESHAYLALGFVALIFLLSGLELLSHEAGMRYVIVLMAAAAGGTLLVVAWRRFGVCWHAPSTSPRQRHARNAKRGASSKSSRRNRRAPTIHLKQDDRTG